jgi:DNA-directed RNA polymerase specialized sigma24 family protein
MSDVALYAWEHWSKVSDMANPSGWLYRVGQSQSRRYFRRPVRLPPPRFDGNPTVEPGLVPSLESLSVKQRVAVLLVHAFGYTVREAAEVIGVGASTLQQNAQRGLSKLRDRLGVTSDV